MSESDEGRRIELADNLGVVRARIASACAAAGRDPTEVTLVAITKNWPAADVIRLAQLGVGDVGENRDQEAAPKAAEVAAAGASVRWHFVGQLQRNKCASVVRYADMVQSVDGVRLATTLGTAAGRHRTSPLDVLVQVNIDGDPGRGGAVTGSADADHALDRVLAAVVDTDALALRGLMAVAPLGWEPERAFTELQVVAAAVRRQYPAAALLSAGMSGDVEEAIRHGATHVRVGTYLLGKRPTLM